jgi:hypothetical protein
MSNSIYHVGLTDAQDLLLVDRWNSYANTAHQLVVGQAYKIMTDDDFDYDILENGHAVVEVPARESNTGNPITFDIMLSDVTLTKQGYEGLLS